MSKWLLYLTILLTILSAVSVEGRRRRRRRRCFPGRKVYDECRQLCVCSANNTLTGCTRLRKEFTTMSKRERRRYIRTVKIVSTDEKYKEEYNNLITLHIRQFFTRGIHNKECFLTWHRWYLLQYENLLRKVNCKVTLPYWDWSIASGEPWGTDPDDLWYSGSTGFGGDGDPGNGGCVSSGPFAAGAWHLVPDANPSCQRRRFNGNPPDVVAIAELLCIDPSNFTEFEFTLRVFHEAVHCLIGGTMCSLDASSAPEFFLHHCFIDKIWDDWQKKSNQHKNVYFSSIQDPLPGISDAYSAVMPIEVLDNLALPGAIRVDYLDVNDTETASVVRRLRKLKPRELRNIVRPDFDAISEESIKLFHLNAKDVRRARREARKFRPRKKRDRKKMKSRKAKRLGLEISDLEEAEKEEKEDKEYKKYKEEKEDLVKNLLFH